jgi:hypothetical protein
MLSSRGKAAARTAAVAACETNIRRDDIARLLHIDKSIGHPMVRRHRHGQETGENPERSRHCDRRMLAASPKVRPSP